MTDITFRFFNAGISVYAVNPEYVEYTTDPCTDIVLSFDEAGTFVTAKLVKRNQEQISDESN